jgi:hypothetical protein
MRKNERTQTLRMHAKVREIDGSKGAARQAAATRSRLRLYAARESFCTNKSRPVTRVDV